MTTPVTTSPLVKVESLTKVFGEGHAAVRAVDSVSLEINAGEMVLIGQLFDAIENITDWCENTVDEVRVLAIRML